MEDITPRHDTVKIGGLAYDSYSLTALTRRVSVGHVLRVGWRCKPCFLCCVGCLYPHEEYSLRLWLSLNSLDVAPGFEIYVDIVHLFLDARLTNI